MKLDLILGSAAAPFCSRTLHQSNRFFDNLLKRIAGFANTLTSGSKGKVCSETPVASPSAVGTSTHAIPDMLGQAIQLTLASLR